LAKLRFLLSQLKFDRNLIQVLLRNLRFEICQLFAAFLERNRIPFHCFDLVILSTLLCKPVFVVFEFFEDGSVVFNETFEELFFLLVSLDDLV
jgi:hypothetical protein